MFPDIKSYFWKYCIYFHTSSCEINNPAVNNAEAQQRYKAIKYYEADNKLLQRVNTGICQSQGMAFEEKNGFLALILPQASRKWAVQPSILQRLIFDVDFMNKCSVLVPAGALFCSQGSDGWALQPFQLYLWTISGCRTLWTIKFILCACRYMLRREKKKDGHDTWLTYIRDL